MDHLDGENIQHHQTFHDNSATHVVTQIQYGADAFFIFDRQKTSKREGANAKVEGATNFGSSKVFEAWEVSGNDQADYLSLAESVSDNYECTYYGDFKISNLPRDVQEAEEFVKVTIFVGKSLSLGLRIL